MNRIPCLLIALALPAGAQDAFLRTCFEPGDTGFGLSLAVGPAGDVHLARIARIDGHLIHTRVDAAGEAVDTEVARRVSRLAIDEVEDTDLLLVDGTPYICFYDAGERRLQVAFEGDEGWVRETVALGQRTGGFCALDRLDGDVVVAYHHQESLWLGRRRGADDWVTSRIDNLAGSDVGLEVDLATVAGRLVAAHHDDRGGLRVSWRVGDEWQTEAPPLDVPGGVNPSVVDDGDGGVWIVHGVRGNQGTDAGLLLTSGRRGALESGFLDGAEIGGSLGATRIEGRLAVATRLLLRSALFPPADGLRYYGALPAGGGHISVESYSAAEQRHVYRFVGLAADPFELPVIAAFDEAGPFGADPGSGHACIWRAPDRDADRIPDPVEARLGTDPDDDDTDDDGRTDGEEWLIDGTDPTGDGPGPPDPDAGAPPPQDAGPEPDAAIVPDASPEVDAALADDAAVAPDDGPEPDAGGEPDAGPTPDVPARPVDGASPDALVVPDVGLIDGAAADEGSIPDDMASGQEDQGADAGGGGGGSGGCVAIPGAAALWWLPLVGRARRRRRYRS